MYLYLKLRAFPELIKRIPRVDSAGNLGVSFDFNLGFGEHLIKKCGAGFARLKVLYKFRDFLSFPVRKILVQRLIFSILDYGDVVYGPCLLKNYENIIQRLQNACARFWFKIPRRFHVRPFLNSHELLNMKYRRQYHLLCFIYDLLRCKEPSYLYDLFTWARNIYGCSLRPRDGLLLLPANKTAALRRSLRFAASKCWNDLPPLMKFQNTLASFKKLCHRWLLDERIQSRAQHLLLCI